jgi:hypothetical protein
MLIITALIIFMVNIHFGYWRGNVKKFSWQWFLAVHLPVPLIIFLRIYLHIGWEWTTYPILVGAYFSGQLVGSKWHKAWKRSMRVSNCLLCDIVRIHWIIIVGR